MKWLSWGRLALLVCLPLLSGSAWADGKVFARAVAVSTPGQRALVYYSNGVEKLVIETSFVGAGTNFAWVVPFPSAPQLQSVSTNFFDLLSQTFQPHLVHDAGGWGFYVVFGAFISAAIWSHRTGRGVLKTLGLFALFLFLFAALAIPNFVRTRGVVTASAGGISILNEQQVGLYDTVTLSGQDGRALLDWLNAHGFYVPASASPVLARYAAEGWVFVAANLNRTNAALLRSRPHPLAFTFASTNVVYPLRLTGVENGTCDLELFVFGPGRARAAGFEAEYCGKPSVPGKPDEEVDLKKEFFAYPGPGEFRFASPELQGFALPAAVVTKLTGKLTAEAMQQDAKIDWVAYRPAVPTLYTREAAQGAALDWFVGIAVLGGLVVQVAAPRLKRRVVWRALLCSLVLGAACGLTRWATARHTEVKWIRGGWGSAANDFRQLDGTMQIFSLERTNSAPLTFDELQSALTNYARWGVRNCFTGEALRHESTPGNLTLHRNSNAVDVVWYDVGGGPHWLATFTNAPRN